MPYYSSLAGPDIPETHAIKVHSSNFKSITIHILACETTTIGSLTLSMHVQQWFWFSISVSIVTS